MQWLVEYNAALASICFMILLGFVDDVLDVPWRVRVFQKYFQDLEVYFYFERTFFSFTFKFNAKPDLSDFEEQEISIAINCCSSSVDGLCWAYNYYYTTASHSLSWARGFGSR